MMKRELRLALAMRGGVSLAVWIGGAIAEIDAVRCARSTDPEHKDKETFWSEVLSHATLYDGVIVDVLAGASAGGLNGVIYAASQVYDFDFAHMRDIWLDVGSTEALVRRKEPWPSLFQGDDYFLSEMYKNLKKLIGTPRKAPCGKERQRVELALSATVIEPVVRPLPSPEGNSLLERRYAAGFRFRHPDEGWLPTDFRPRDVVDFDDTIWRLALAARATSSYPGAFEAAEVHSTRRETFGSTRAGTGTGCMVDMDGTFLDRTIDKAPFVVADGGILDNIPIQCALDFIANAPAAGPTERFLVYLQPGASSIPDPTPTNDRTDEANPEAAELRRQARRSTLAVGRGVLGARVAGETINADIAAMEAYNEAVIRAESLRTATFQSLCDRAKFNNAAREACPTYVLTRASYEARQVFSLLLDPMGVMGEDQFPERVAKVRVLDDRWRSPIALWPQARRERLEDELRAAIKSRLTGFNAGLLTGTGDVGPLLRVTDLLIAWARWVEKITPPDGEDFSPSDVKGRLYRVRAFLGTILDRTRRLAWVSAAARVDEKNGAFAELALRSLRSLTDMDPSTVQATQAALETGERGPLEKACHDAMARIDGAVGACTRAAATGTPLTDEPPQADRNLLLAIAGLLVEMAEPLCRARPANSEHGSRADRTYEPAELLHRVLGGEPGITLDDLVALEVLCLQEFVSGMPGRRPIRFRHLSTANPTPVAPHFEALLAAAEEAGLWWDPKNACRETDPGANAMAAVIPEKPGEACLQDPAKVRSGDQKAACLARQEGIHVTLKLAGNELANFSAFLLPHWRANDWLWGRLDAVPTMVDLLVSPEDLAERLKECTTPEAALERIHHLVVPANDDRLERLVWEPSKSRIRAELDVLRADDGVPVKDKQIKCIRTALVARRQWEILAEEQALLANPMGKVPGVDPPVEEWVKGYKVGAETLRDSSRSATATDGDQKTEHKTPSGDLAKGARERDRSTQSQELLDRFAEIAEAATEAVLFNVCQVPGPSGKALLARPPGWVEAALRRAGPTVGRAVAERLVLPKSSEPGRGRKLGVGLLIAVLIGLGILGFVIDRSAFLLGTVVSFLPLAALAFGLYGTVRWILGLEPSHSKLFVALFAASVLLLGGFGWFLVAQRRPFLEGVAVASAAFTWLLLALYQRTKTLEGRLERVSKKPPSSAVDSKRPEL